MDSNKLNEINIKIKLELKILSELLDELENQIINFDKCNNNYSWLVLETYLSYLKKFINTYQVTNNQLKVQSVTLISGSIFFNTFALGKSLTDYMKSLGLKPFNYKNDKTKIDNALNYITNELFANNLLDASVNSGYYSNTVNIIQKNGSIIKAFGILIKLEAFGFKYASEAVKDMPDELQGITDIVIVKKKIKEPKANDDPFSL
jgi:hypothetical protein